MGRMPTAQHQQLGTSRATQLWCMIRLTKTSRADARAHTTHTQHKRGRRTPSYENSMAKLKAAKSHVADNTRISWSTGEIGNTVARNKHSEHKNHAAWLPNRYTRAMSVGACAKFKRTHVSGNTHIENCLCVL